MVNFILDSVLKLELPTGAADTPERKAFYVEAKKKVKSYHGQPDVLLEAIALLERSSEAYACIGLAQVLTAAAYLAGDAYDREGLTKAVGYLDKAKALPHDAFELGLTEASIRTAFAQDEKAKELLYRLIEAYPDALEPHMELLHNYVLNRELEQAETLYGKLLPATPGADRKALYDSMYQLYILEGRFERAIEFLKKALLLEPHNPWTHHNLSLIYLHMGEIAQSRHHNKKALGIMPFGNALMVKEELKRMRWRSGKGLITSIFTVLSLFTFVIRLATLVPAAPTTPTPQRLSPSHTQSVQAYGNQLAACGAAMALKDKGLAGVDCSRPMSRYLDCLKNSADTEICRQELEMYLGDFLDKKYSQHDN